MTLSNQLNHIMIAVLCMTIWASCMTSDAYQRQSPVAEGKWRIKDQKLFTFDIDDTTAPYDISLILRNDDAYPYENLWVKLQVKYPGDTTFSDSAMVNTKLSDVDGRWLGRAQGSLYDHSIRIQAKSLSLIGKRVGRYSIQITQMMRQDPLNGIHNVGLRVQKVK